MVGSFISSLRRTASTAGPAAERAAPKPESNADAATASRPVAASSASASQQRTGLRAALFEAVKPTHASVAEHPFFTALHTKALTKAQLAAYLADQEHVLEALETTVLVHADQAALRPMADLRVTNRQGLAAADAADLGFESLPHPSSAACRLAAHIGQLTDGQQYAAVAVHAWVQYNAMLNGGQQMAYALRKLFPQTQMSLFSFTPPASQMRRAYADSINAVAIKEGDEAYLCAEAQTAFLANKNMLDDVMGQVGCEMQHVA